MFLPDDILRLIREFSSPIGLRLDWRTCKRTESRRIKMSDRALQEWYRWIIGRDNVHPLYEEIKQWTFYGRRHLILESKHRIWSIQHPQDPDMNDPEWYEKRFVSASQFDRPEHLMTPFIEDNLFDYPLDI